MAQRTEEAETAFKKGGRKAPRFHMQALIDGWQLFNWIWFVDKDELEEQWPTFKDAVYFNGNKVLEMDKELDTAWMDALYNVSKATHGFVTANLE